MSIRVLIVTTTIFFYLLLGFEELKAQLRQTPILSQLKNPLDTTQEQNKARIALLTSRLDTLNPWDDYAQKFSDRLKERFRLFNQIYTSNKKPIEDLQKVPWFELSQAEVNFSQQVAQRQGNIPTNLPRNFARLDVNSQASLWSIPLKVQGLLTTEQTAGRQAMNRFRISLDVRQYQKKIQKRLDQQIRDIEKNLEIEEDFPDLEKLYDFQAIKKMNFKSSKALKKYLKEFEQYDSLKNIKWQKEVSQLRDKLKDSLQRNLKQKKLYTQVKEFDPSKPGQLKKYARQKAKNLQKNKLETSKKKLKQVEDKRKKDKSTRKKDKALTKFLEENNLNVQDLEQLMHKRDSLQKLKPEMLLGYENILILKKIQKGENLNYLEALQTQGIGGAQFKFLNAIQTLEIGTSTPHFSNYTLRGLPITGLHTEIQYKNLYLAWVGSKNLEASLEQAVHNRKIQAGRIGLGTKEENHTFFTFLQGQDDGSSLLGDTLLTGITGSALVGSPRKNYVLGLDFQYIKDNLTCQIELSQSVSALNLQENSIAWKDVWNFWGESQDDTRNIQSGVAASLLLSYSLGENTQLSWKGERISPYYLSLGTPFLRTDLLGYEVSLQHSLWQGKLKLEPSYSLWKDNLGLVKDQTTFMKSYGFKFNFQTPNLPYLNFAYQANLVSNQTDNRINVIQANIGHNYDLWEIQMQSSLSLSWNQSTTEQMEEIPNNLDISTKSITFNQSLFFRNSLELSLLASYLDENDGLRNRNLELINQGAFAYRIRRRGLHQGQWINLEGRASYHFFGIWRNEISYLEGVGEQGGWQRRLMIESSMPIFNRTKLILRGEYNSLSTVRLEDNFQEFLGRITFNYSF